MAIGEVLCLQLDSSQTSCKLRIKSQTQKWPPHTDGTCGLLFCFRGHLISFCKLHSLLTEQINIGQIFRYLFTASNTDSQLLTRGPKAVPFCIGYKQDETGGDVVRGSSVMLTNSSDINKMNIVRRQHATWVYTALYRASQPCLALQDSLPLLFSSFWGVTGEGKTQLASLSSDGQRGEGSLFSLQGSCSMHTLVAGQMRCYAYGPVLCRYLIKKWLELDGLILLM